MSKVIMMCGVCGSGKTTYAKKKEQEGYIRLNGSQNKLNGVIEYDKAFGI